MGGLGRMCRSAARDWHGGSGCPTFRSSKPSTGAGGWEEAVTQGWWASWPEPKSSGPRWPCDSGSRAGCQGLPDSACKAPLWGREGTGPGCEPSSFPHCVNR